MFSDRPTHAIVLSYDLSKPKSLETVRMQLEYLKTNPEWDGVPLYLVGMNSDNLALRKKLGLLAHGQTNLRPFFVTSVFSGQEMKVILNKIKSDYLTDTQEVVNHYTPPESSRRYTI